MPRLIPPEQRLSTVLGWNLPVMLIVLDNDTERQRRFLSLSSTTNEFLGVYELSPFGTCYSSNVEVYFFPQGFYN